MMIIWIAVIAVSVGLDQLTKALIAGSYQLGETHTIIPHIINFKFIRNEGAAWGMFSDSRWVFIVISAVLIIVLPFILYKFRKLHFLFGFSLSLIIGGAIGNMIDRVFAGSVVDFIEFSFFNFPVFNVADICVTVGAVMMFIYLVFFDKTLFRSDKKKTTGDSGEKATDDTQNTTSSDNANTPKQEQENENNN